MTREFLSCLLVAGALLATARPAAVQAQAFDLPEIPRCTQVTPGAIATGFTPARLAVRVVLDGVAPTAAGAAVASAMASYFPQDITLDISYDSASFSSRDAGELIDEVRRSYGGRRPADTHLVYVLTSKDLTAAGFGDALAGLADCIGGVAFPENAFAVGEARPSIAAEVMAHEIGHLLGGHHHYANCAESLPNGGSAPCTLMINDVGLAGLPFSSLNGSVVRGHAQIYGGDTAAEAGGGDGGGTLSLLLVAPLLGAALRRRLIRAG